MATRTEPESVRTDDPDLVAETKISRIMRPLNDATRAAVVAWFARKYITLTPAGPAQEPAK